MKKKYTPEEVRQAKEDINRILEEHSRRLDAILGKKKEVNEHERKVEERV